MFGLPLIVPCSPNTTHQVSNKDVLRILLTSLPFNTPNTRFTRIFVNFKLLGISARRSRSTLPAMVWRPAWVLFPQIIYTYTIRALFWVGKDLAVGRTYNNNKRIWSFNKKLETFGRNFTFKNATKLFSETKVFRIKNCL